MIKGYVESAGEDGFSIYASEDIPVWGYGASQKDAEDDFKKCYHEQAKEIASNSNGEYPKWYSEDPIFAFEPSR